MVWETMVKSIQKKSYQMVWLTPDILGHVAAFAKEKSVAMNTAIELILIKYFSNPVRVKEIVKTEFPCPVCMKRYEISDEVLKHMRESEMCKRFLLEGGKEELKPE